MSAWVIQKPQTSRWLSFQFRKYKFSLFKDADLILQSEILGMEVLLDSFVEYKDTNWDFWLKKMVNYY